MCYRLERNCTSRRSRRMKNFILGIILTLIIGGWITLAVVGVISVKVAIIVPVALIIDAILGIWLLFSNWEN